MAQLSQLRSQSCLDFPLAGHIAPSSRISLLELVLGCTQSNLHRRCWQKLELDLTCLVVLGPKLVAVDPFGVAIQRPEKHSRAQ